ncbi:MAG TPA: hypothetical protein V6D27_01055 [Vampirovibrionales bacterium]
MSTAARVAAATAPSSAPVLALTLRDMTAGIAVDFGDGLVNPRLLISTTMGYRFRLSQSLRTS